MDTTGEQPRPARDLPDHEPRTEVIESSGLDHASLGGPPPEQPPGGPAADGDGGGKRRGRWIAAGVGAVTLALVAGGTTFAVRTLASSGEQPEKFVPANALALVKVDLDPSAGQKIEAIRFLRHFPELRDNVSENEDLRRSFWDLLAEDDEALKDIDFDKEVKPWLGDRAAVAVLPAVGAAKEPDVQLVFQLSDEGKAKAALPGLLDKAGESGDETGFAIRDGYVVVADDQARADRFAKAADTGGLGADAGYRADLKDLDGGIASAWVDLPGALRAAFASDQQLKGRRKELDQVLGQFDARSRFVAGVKFDGGHLEANGRFTGVEGYLKPSPDAAWPIGRLPADTVAAVGLSGIGGSAAQAWKDFAQRFEAEAGDEGPSLDELTGQLKDRYGIALPADLETLFGRGLAIGVSGQGLDREPQVGARVVTDPAKGKALVAKLMRMMAELAPDGPRIAYKRTDDGMVVASSPGYAAKLQGDGGLGGTDAFKDALPDAGSADVALWLDVDTLVAKLGTEFKDAKTRENLSHLDAVGLTSGQQGEKTRTFRLRVVAK